MFVKIEERPALIPSRENDSETLDAASKLLLKAAALIEERGWCQFAPTRGRALCVVGALRLALYGNPDRAIEEGPIARAAVTRLRDRMGGDIGIWNDLPGRTAAEAVSTIRSVALGG